MAEIDKPAPNQVLLTLLQQNLPEYINSLGKPQTFEIRPRYSSDYLPALYSILTSATPEQRGIPHGKHVLDRVNVTIMYYTDDLDLLWSGYQAIKEIVVGNNKVASTTQFSSPQIQWTMIKDVDFDYVYLSEESLIGFVAVTFEAVYDENYT